MKIGILFDIQRANGGSFQMSLNNLNTIIDNLKQKDHKFLIITHKNHPELNKLNFKHQIIKLTVIDYFFFIINNIVLFKKIFNIFNFSSPFEKKLIKKNINLLIFFSVSWKLLLLKKIFFITTVLDVAHKDFYKKKIFKEISFFVYLIREYLYKNILPLSYRIIVESITLKKKIIKLYKVKSKNVISIPNIPSILLKKKKINIKKQFNIVNKFYFYPAQFWEHKNHLIILETVKYLKNNNKDIYFIFSGRDKGNLINIKKKIDEYGLLDNIKIIGYVTDQELFELYKSCEALVMPSYFGPTNIPPVEAWSMGVPVLYSSLNRNHGKDACLYFNANSSYELSQAILDVSRSKKRLIRKGIKRYNEIKRENIAGHKILVKDICSFIKYS
jgi:glycosyltransferase involved in cell wall biosynthesis